MRVGTEEHKDMMRTRCFCILTGIDGRQTYQEYRKTMNAYEFIPSSREEWETAQTHLHGSFKTDKGEIPCSNTPHQSFR